MSLKVIELHAGIRKTIRRWWENIYTGILVITVLDIWHLGNGIEARPFSLNHNLYTPWTKYLYIYLNISIRWEQTLPCNKCSPLKYIANIRPLDSFSLIPSFYSQIYNKNYSIHSRSLSNRDQFLLLFSYTCRVSICLFDKPHRFALFQVVYHRTSIKARLPFKNIKLSERECFFLTKKKRTDGRNWESRVRNSVQWFT